MVAGKAFEDIDHGKPQESLQSWSRGIFNDQSALTLDSINTPIGAIKLKVNKTMLNPYRSAAPPSKGDRAAEIMKLAQKKKPKMVPMLDVGVRSAKNASEVANRPKDAKPRTMHGTTITLIGTAVRANSEMDCTNTRMQMTCFLPIASDSFPHMGALNRPAILSVEKRKDANMKSAMPLP